MTSTALSRRGFFGVALGLALPRIGGEARAEIFKDMSGLKAGNFIWQPRLAATGPLVILVSPTEQIVNVYRGRERIGISTCRIGRDGAQVPFGVWSLIDQSRRPISQNEAGGRRSWRAAASYAEGLQRAGAALPIRLPKDLGDLLASATEAGAAIVIAPRRTVPVSVSHACGARGDEVAAIGERAIRGLETADAMGEEAHIVICGAGKAATVVRGGKAVETTPIAIAEPHRPLGTHLFALQGRSADGATLEWLAVSLAQRNGPAQLGDNAAAATLERIIFKDAAGATAIRSALGARSVLVVTDASANAETRLAAPGLEIFSDGDAGSQPGVASGARKGRFVRKGIARTADGGEPRTETQRLIDPLY